MTIYPRTAVVFLAWTLVQVNVFAGRSMAGATFTQTDLCEILRKPNQFNGAWINIHAQYDSDGFEHEGLTEASCPDVGIGVHTNDRVKGIAELYKALGTGRPGTTDKVITGQFSGSFTWDPNRHPRGLLRVTRIEHIRVLPLKK